MEKFIPTLENEFKIGATVMVNWRYEVAEGLIIEETKTLWKVKVDSQAYLLIFNKNSGTLRGSGDAWFPTRLSIYNEAEIKEYALKKRRSHIIYNLSPEKLEKLTIEQLEVLFDTIYTNKKEL